MFYFDDYCGLTKNSYCIIDYNKNKITVFFKGHYLRTYDFNRPLVIQDIINLASDIKEDTENKH